MAESTFSLTYDGQALRNHEMPVRDLAPALLALGDVFVAASKELYPKRDPVGLNIKTTSDGSFLVHLALHSPHAWDQILEVLGGTAITALSNIESMVTGTKGVFAYLKARKNRQIVSAETAPEPGVLKVKFTDGATLEVPSVVLDMGEKISIRRATQAVVGPVAREGIEIVKFDASIPSIEPLVIAKEDLPAFDFPAPPQIEEPPDISHRKAWLTIAMLRFEERNVWRFSDGTAYFAAVIEDEGFLHRVENREIGFLSGDSLYCDLRVEQTRRSDGRPHTSYFVERVLESQTGGGTIGLF
jgi:hypothetical protein